MFAHIVKKVFGSKHEREIKRLMPLVRRINELESQCQALSDEQLVAKTPEFKTRLQNGDSLDSLLPEAYAVVKNACRRLMGTKLTVTGQEITWNMIPFDVQLLGGIALHRGGIAEMQTGEGKTLVAVMPLYLNALTGRNCQLVTVNDYLALRDSQWVGTVLRFLGLTVGCIQNQMNSIERRAMYVCDITYGTNSEFGFDYLRDMGMAVNPDDLVQRDHYFAIVDEIDSILIDEARTPLIISGPAAVSTHRYDELQPIVDLLFRRQSKLCTEFATKAKAILVKPHDELSDAEWDEAMTLLMQVKLGMPKHKQLLRLMEDAAVVRGLEKKDMEVHSDQNRGMLQDLKERLYFSIDEKAGDADLSELGRTSLRPSDPDSFVLPDLASEYQLIDENDQLTEAQKQEARAKLQQLLDDRSETIHNISQLLRAHCLFERDVQYVVKDNKVFIVDEFTGRIMPGRRFSEGLHQALEAKEHVAIERETQTLASITIQNYFRLYDKLAGMTGTAETEATEFKDIYKLEVLAIPTNKPCIRADRYDRIFKTKREKYNSIIADVKECHGRGQPILLGTVSVEVSEVLSRLLKREQIPHTVLNAKNHQREAEIIAGAGQRGAVTIATNMAGRGTDIRLGDGVDALGGLHVIGSERHDARRIDRQLRGRCARQGDPGSSRFYISLEDDLMRLFGSDRIAGLMERFGFEEGEELSHPLLNRSIEGAQKKVEQQHYSIRRRTLQFDDVSNKQRKVIYGTRKEILSADDTRKILFEFTDSAIFDRLEASRTDVREHGYPFDRQALLHWLNSTFPIGFTDADLEVAPQAFDAEALVQRITKRVEDAYQIKIKGEDPERVRRMERHLMLRAHDQLWQEHLYAIDDLRSGIYLRAHGQRDPLIEFKQEAFQMFGDLLTRINEEIAGTIFRSQTVISAFQQLLASLPRQEIHNLLGQFAMEPEVQAPVKPSAETEEAPLPMPKGVTYHRVEPKIGRNDPCICGSGKKYKRCCGQAVVDPATPGEGG